MIRFKLILIVIAAAFAGLYALPAGKATPSVYVAAPRAVGASDGDYIDKVSVTWSAVRGATRYRVYRSLTTDLQTAAEIGSTPAGYYFDTSATPLTNYFYWVRAESDSGASELSSPDSGSRASGSFNDPIFSPLEPPPSPSLNPVTAAKAMLGKTLFWDEQLSSTLTVACGTCHRPAAGGGDPRAIPGDARSRNPGFDGVPGTGDDVFGSPGVIGNTADGILVPTAAFGLNEQVTSRKSPSYLNVGTTTNGTFWDGRAANTFRDPLTNTVLFSDWGGLESQSVGPPMSAVEMAHSGRNWSQAAEQIRTATPLALATNVPASLRDWIDGRSYPRLFEDAFGSPDVTPARIALAIATHERTLFSDRAPLDKFASSIPALTAEEDRGRQVFVGASCNFCHGAGLLSDQNFHNIGVRPQNEDLGRGGVSGNSGDNGRFKTPNLRNVELRPSFFHNGRFSTLEEVVDFYNRGGDFSATNINRGLIRPLNLTAQQKSDLVAFLKRPLTDTRVRDERPPFDRPRLNSESARVPEMTGTGRPGAGGIEPRAHAIEPPLAGNPSFSVGLSGGLANSAAVLVIDDADPGAGGSIPGSGSLARIASQTDAGGFASASIALDPTLAGRTFFGRWYVTDGAAAGGFSVTKAFRFTVFRGQIAVGRRAVADFDGDARTDVSVYRPSNGQWWMVRSGSDSSFAATFGNPTDTIVPADYTGDGRADIAVWRSGEWFVMRSEDSSYFSFPFGIAGDVPVPGDYDADGRADAAVFRPSSGTWYVSLSTGGTTIKQFGAGGDRPLTADFDGDGRSDIAVFRPANGQWWIERSSGGIAVFTFGTGTDRIVPADFTGDGRADIAVWRPSTGEWFILRSEDASYFAVNFGMSGDIPAPGDYDGDGRTDTAVFRPSTGTWYANRSGSGLLIYAFGANGDQPAPTLYP